MFLINKFFRALLGKRKKIGIPLHLFIEVKVYVRDLQDGKKWQGLYNYFYSKIQNMAIIRISIKLLSKHSSFISASKLASYLIKPLTNLLLFEFEYT